MYFYCCNAMSPTSKILVIKVQRSHMYWIRYDYQQEVPSLDMMNYFCSKDYDDCSTPYILSFFFCDR